MKKETIIFSVLAAFAGTVIGGTTGWFIGTMYRKPQEVSKISPCKVLVINENDDFDINLSANEGEIGQEIDFKISSSSSKYFLDYVNINDQKYIPNTDKYFYFNLKEGQNTIEPVYKLVSSQDYDKDEFVNVHIEDNEYNGEAKILYNGEKFEEKEVHAYRTIDLEFEPHDGYYLNKVLINNEFILCHNEDESYSFRTFKPENGEDLMIFPEFLKDGEIVDDKYTEFQSILENDYNGEIEKINLASEEILNKFSIADLARISFLRVQNLKENYLAKSYNEARSTAAFITNVQSTNTAFIKNNDHLMKEVISYSSNAQYSQRILNKDNYNDLEIYFSYGDKVESNFKADFVNYSQKVDTTISDYVLDYGIQPFDLINYQLYTSYMLNESSDICGEKFDSAIVKTTDGYILTLNLSPSSVYNYAKYMTSTTDYPGASSIIQQVGAPIFSKVGLKMVLSNDFYPVEYITREEYEVQSKFGANVPTKGYGSSTFYYDDPSENPEMIIPNLDKNVDYEETYGKIDL